MEDALQVKKRIYDKDVCFRKKLGVTVNKIEGYERVSRNIGKCLFNRYTDIRDDWNSSLV